MKLVRTMEGIQNYKIIKSHPTNLGSLLEATVLPRMPRMNLNIFLLLPKLYTRKLTLLLMLSRRWPISRIWEQTGTLWWDSLMLGKVSFSLLHSPYPWILLEDLEDCGNVLDGVADDEDGHNQERDLGEVSLPLAQRRVRAPPQRLKHSILLSEIK